jgi:cysteinyl-tRNA synthetase
MTLKIYNTLTRDKTTFQPIKEGEVSLYACGMTVYDYCHLGHARTYTFIDMIVRYLTFLGYQVKYVRNITDIDDKIIKRAQDKQVDFQHIVKQFTEAMHEDFSALQLFSPTHEPRATDYIPHMLRLIEAMLANNHAYVASNGDVYFRIRSLASYGMLSHHDLEQLESGARVDIVDVKEDPLDFVLWKLAKPNEPHWPSPFGEGRPGWHTECTAMSMDLLGERFDLHAGARDLIFPHHENELAQANAVSQAGFAVTWMHMGFLNIAQEKMSKSLGNFVTIRDALKTHDPEVLRYLFLTSHYRSPLMYTDELMQQAKQALTRFYTALRFLPKATAPVNSTYEAQFFAAMNDDFNTPVALSVLFELAHDIQRHRDKDQQLACSLAALLKHLAGILGLLTREPEAFFQLGQEVDVEKIDALIKARNVARQ